MEEKEEGEFPMRNCTWQNGIVTYVQVVKTYVISPFRGQANCEGPLSPQKGRNQTQYTKTFRPATWKGEGA